MIRESILILLFKFPPAIFTVYLLRMNYDLCLCKTWDIKSLIKSLAGLGFDLTGSGGGEKIIRNYTIILWKFRVLGLKSHRPRPLGAPVAPTPLNPLVEIIKYLIDYWILSDFVINYIVIFISLLFKHLWRLCQWTTLA